MKIKILCLLVAYLLCFNLSYADDVSKNDSQISEKYTPDYIEQHLSELDIIKSGKKSSYTGQIRQAINCYKSKNYTSCLQILKNVEKKEPYNSVVTYYLGLANLKLGKKDDALSYFKSTSLLDPSSIVGKYAKQTLDSINNPEVLNNVNLISDEVGDFIKSGKKVAPEVVSQMTKQRLNAEKDEINSDIKKQTEELKRQRIKERQQNNSLNNQNNNMSQVEPTNDEIAQAVKTFQKLGLNPFNSQPNLALNQMNAQQKQQMQSINNDMMQLSMLMGQANNNANNNNMMNMLPFMMMSNNNQNSNFKMTPEMIQTMMMSQMMPNLDFGMNTNNSRN